MNKVILYSNNCPKCNIIKSKLLSEKIEFTENSDFEELVSLGIKSLPVLKIGSQVLDFYSANSWVNERGAVNGY